MGEPDVKTTHLGMIAAERNGIEGWEAYAWKVVDGSVIVKGAVPRVLTRGKNKGRRRWPPESDPSFRRHIIAIPDAVAWVLAQEAATGECSACGASGREVARWSSSEPAAYRDCRRCGGSGTAPPAVTR